MTAHHLIYHQSPRPHFNKKDTPPRPCRRDIAADFEAAGFVMVAGNKFEFVAYGSVFSVAPSFAGLKVIGLETEAVFAFGTQPDVIADWILDWPNRVTDWLTANLPEGDSASDQPPACYGLAKGEY